MSHDALIAVIRQKAGAIVPGTETLPADAELSEAGFSSLEFVELTSTLMRELKIKVPRGELADVKTFTDLARVLHRADDRRPAS